MKELTGTIDDIKDFMFVVTDDKDTPYSFTFDEKPDGLESCLLYTSGFACTRSLDRSVKSEEVCLV